MYKRNYLFRMNVVEEIFEIRSCIEVLPTDSQQVRDTEINSGMRLRARETY